MAFTLVLFYVLADRRRSNLISRLDLGPSCTRRLEMGFKRRNDVWSSVRINGFTPRSSELVNVLLAVKTKTKNSQSLDLDRAEKNLRAEGSFSVWLSWMAAPPTSGLLAFALLGGCPRLYGLPLPPPPSSLSPPQPQPQPQPQPGPSSHCRRKTRRKCQPVSAATSRSMCCTKMCFWRVMAGRGALTRVSTCNS